MARSAPASTVETLRGSSPPGGRAPSFKPTADAPEPVEGSVATDPVLAVIERHRHAYAEWYRVSEGGPMTKAEGDVEAAALQAVAMAQPSTFEGLASWIDYLAAVVERDDAWVIAKAALPCIARAVRGLLAVAPLDRLVAQDAALAAMSVNELDALREACVGMSIVVQGIDNQPRVTGACHNLLQDLGAQLDKFDSQVLAAIEAAQITSLDARYHRISILVGAAAREMDWPQVLHLMAGTV